jgi:diguanylate cyclase (GGDEF)-like protein/PAS domain S-box-containing protein/putative nucleotidyltransferase with HDIG domain
MNIKKKYKITILTATSLFVCLITLFIHDNSDLEAVYVSLFYIPILMTGLWYYRFTIPLATALTVYCYILDFIDMGRWSINHIYHGFILIFGSLVVYYLSKKLSRTNQELETSRSILAIEKEHLRITLQSIGDGVISIDYNGNVIMLNEVAKNLTGWLGDTAVGRPFAEAFEIINEFSRENGENIVNNVLESGKILELANHTILISKDGIERPIAESAAPIQDENGNIHGVILVFRDVTESKKAQDALKLSAEKYSNYIENAPDGVFVIDEKGHYIEVNRAFSKMTGYSKDELLQMTIRDLLTKEGQEAGMNHFNNLLEKGSARGSLQHKHKDGTKIWLTVHAVKLTEHRFLGFAKDITYQKKGEEQILYISYHDQLTGLYNRRFYEEELKRLDTKRNLPLTIVMGDINGLKLINDSFGHAMGDELLRKVAEVIKNACRADDIIARIGGDEFVIILPKTDAFETEQIIKRIKDLSLKEKVGNIDISISFGYAAKSNEEENIQEIFKYAEDLMYQHKRSESSGIRSKTIDLVMNTLYKKSSREQLHSIKVSEICEAIATKMDFSENDVYQIKIAGLLHDIGKIEIDEKILNKPEKLSKDEWERMQRHPEIGYRILSSVNEFSVIAEDILEHHERWDGKGYPRGLKGEEISLHARIIAVADSYDAMTSDRTYDKTLSEEEAINEIRRCSGTQFDPEVTRIFIEKVLGQEWEQLNKI